MQNILEAKQIIGEAKNIYLLPSQGPEAIASTMALFYTLKDLGKNVNLILDSLPENLRFLAPSLDFISYPKNFVVSIPNNVAQVSQIYYEKNENINGFEILEEFRKQVVFPEKIQQYFDIILKVDWFCIDPPSKEIYEEIYKLFNIYSICFI